ncbi:pantoate--beta-alanine ligase [Flavobacterium okayamense]|uniref:Pantothenate synthetase n=1 Tax=Flavobacterium okayamense TaxID=2830782 RepID=A0ABM7S3C9_9FLAO|nr:pantoate--beta-alanine ligase [Flavobacterium okayamense]BCY27980.1 pantothenate synthetase [Flavobacterium okayamense]
MLVFTEKVNLQKHLESFHKTNKSVGFVPTMGALHEGHLSLLEQSLIDNEITVISIFVNPTQFNNSEDLKKYPRTLDNDVKKIESLSKEIIVFSPSVDEIYQGKTISLSFNFDGLENQMEGKHRPGHFDGVGTIVKMLFEIVKPNKAYFGQKDFQQLQIVKKLVSKYKIPVEIIGCPIHRESNGLAMSSRNQRLSEKAKNDASLIYKTLKKSKEIFKTKSANETIKFVEREFSKHPDFELEYFEIADEKTLLTCKRKSKSKKYRAFIAVFVEGIRLIDNLSL